LLTEREDVEALWIEECKNPEGYTARLGEADLALVADCTSLDAVLAAIRACKASGEVRVLVVTGDAGETVLRQYFQAGADGLLLKKSLESELTAALAALLHGAKYVSASLASEFAARYLTEPVAIAVKPSGEALTARQKEIIRLAALGHTSREIGDQLGISPKTVETHRTRLMAKLGLSSRAELVEHAMQHGLLPVPAG